MKRIALLALMIVAIGLVMYDFTANAGVCNGLLANIQYGANPCNPQPNYANLGIWIMGLSLVGFIVSKPLISRIAARHSPHREMGHHPAR